MTRDDIINMAEEADLWADQELQCIGEYHPDWHEVRDIRFAALVAAAEREACAKLCEEYETNNDIAETWLNIVSEVIRARGQE